MEPNLFALGCHSFSDPNPRSASQPHQLAAVPSAPPAQQPPRNICTCSPRRLPADTTQDLVPSKLSLAILDAINHSETQGPSPGPTPAASDVDRRPWSCFFLTASAEQNEHQKGFEPRMPQLKMEKFNKQKQYQQHTRARRTLRVPHRRPTALPP